MDYSSIFSSTTLANTLELIRRKGLLCISWWNTFLLMMSIHSNVAAMKEVRRIRRGQVKSGFHASGADFGFSDAVGCADFVAKVRSAASE